MLQEQFQAYITSQALFQKSEGLLLAVSGGVDSVVLVELCHRSGYAFAIAHANFQLRGEESDRDEAFVRALAQQYQVPVFVRSFATELHATTHRQSIQEAARTLRYEWFREILAANPHWKVLTTAHHADDHIETITMNFFRGTGIAGLRGLLPKQGDVIHPLLPFRKSDLIHFAEQEKLRWVEDRSNATADYTRNYFRLTLLPLLEKAYPAAAMNILENADRFREVELLYQQAVDRYRKQLLFPKGEELHLPVEKLRRVRPLKTILFELMKAYGFGAAQLPDLIHLLDSETGKYVASPTHRVIKNRHWLVIAPIAASAVHHFLVEAMPQVIRTAYYELALHEAAFPVTFPLTDPNQAYLDAAQLHFPLLLRRWKAGDYFYPLGMKKKKKIARFLIDEKLSKTEKEQVWVLVSGQQVVWVVGHRIDERFKLTPNTQKVVRVLWKSI